MGRRGAAAVILAVAGPFWALLASCAEDKPEPVELPVGGGKFVTIYRYQGRNYEAVSMEDLRSAALAGKLVCVEGKFNEMLGKDSFGLIGGDREMVFTDKGTVNRLMRGDNVWVGGEAQKYTRKPECFVNANYVVKLPDDFALFEERHRKYAEEKNWRKLWELGVWIEEMGKINVSSNYESYERYKQLARRAYCTSLIAKAEGLPPTDAEGFYQIAEKLLSIDGPRQQAIQYLRRAAAIDPNHAKTGAKLTEFGFERYKDQWVTKTEKQKLLEQEQAELDRARREEQERRRKEEERRLVMQRDREKLLCELLQKVRLGKEADFADVAKVLASHEDSILVRRVLFAVVNSGEPAAVEAFLAATRNPSPEVRCDAADALAWRGAESRALVASMAGSSDNPTDVRLHAVDALTWTGGVEAVDSLVSLADASDEPRMKERVFRALTELTGESHDDAQQWKAWWKASKDGFVPKR